MAYVEKRGVLVSVSDHATHDFIVGWPVLSGSIRRDDGSEINVRFPMGARFRIDLYLWSEITDQYDLEGERFLALDNEAVSDRARRFTNDPYYPVNPNSTYSRHEALIRPAIGDMIQIGWDYGQFQGEIIKFAENRQPIANDLPITDSRAFSAIDIVESIDPDSAE